MEKIIKQLLEEIGENPNRDGLLRTPKRVSEMYEFLTKGYNQNLDQIINNALYDAEGSEMIVVRDIDFYSLCEHHLVPFFGRVHVAYIPQKKIIGLSKIPRIVEMFSRRLQLQERMTTQIANTLMDVLEPEGVAVVIEAQHLCMQMRGVEKQNSVARTNAIRGVFMDDAQTRNEFFQSI